MMPGQGPATEAFTHAPSPMRQTTAGSISNEMTMNSFTCLSQGRQLFSSRQQRGLQAKVFTQLKFLVSRHHLCRGLRCPAAVLDFTTMKFSMDTCCSNVGKRTFSVCAFGTAFKNNVANPRTHELRRKQGYDPQSPISSCT